MRVFVGLGSVLESGHAGRIKSVHEGSHATVQRTMEATYITDLNEEEQRALDALSQKYTLIEAFEQKSRESSNFLTKQQDVLKKLDLDERQAQKNVAALEAAFARFDEEKRTVASLAPPRLPHVAPVFAVHAARIPCHDGAVSQGQDSWSSAADCFVCARRDAHSWKPTSLRMMLS